MSISQLAKRAIKGLHYAFSDSKIQGQYWVSGTTTQNADKISRTVEHIIEKINQQGYNFVSANSRTSYIEDMYKISSVCFVDVDEDNNRTENGNFLLTITVDKVNHINKFTLFYAGEVPVE